MSAQGPVLHVSISGTAIGRSRADFFGKAKKNISLSLRNDIRGDFPIKEYPLQCHFGAPGFYGAEKSAQGPVLYVSISGTASPFSVQTPSTSNGFAYLSFFFISQSIDFVLQLHYHPFHSLTEHEQKDILGVYP
ncbi:MAG: hypothetical protein AAGU05_02020, partial [Anaerolineaceae bacterium]